MVTKDRARTIDCDTSVRLPEPVMKVIRSCGEKLPTKGMAAMLIGKGDAFIVSVVPEFEGERADMILYNAVQAEHSAGFSAVDKDGKRVRSIEGNYLCVATIQFYTHIGGSMTTAAYYIKA